MDKIQRLVVDGAQEKKAFDILVLDLNNRSDITDCFVICSGNTKIHVQAIADSIIDQTYGTEFKSLAVEGYWAGKWIVIDLVDQGALVCAISRNKKRLDKLLLESANSKLFGFVCDVTKKDQTSNIFKLS